ncbi:MAG: hypothetical protein FJ030_02990 [Chloroflexi bacterium]|nr:hypothetical protein [Chloroflexota bacterium]
MLYQSQQEEAWVSAALLQVAEAVARQATLEEGLEAVARLTPMLVGIDRVAIYQWDESARVFHASQIAGLNKSQTHFLKQMPLQADEIGVDPADPAQQPILKFIMPESLADIFCCREAMVWPLRARAAICWARWWWSTCR